MSRTSLALVLRLLKKLSERCKPEFRLVREYPRRSVSEECGQRAIRYVALKQSTRERVASTFVESCA